MLSRSKGLWLEMETVRLKFWDNLWETYKEQTLQECQMTYKRNGKKGVGKNCLILITDQHTICRVLNKTARACGISPKLYQHFQTRRKFYPCKNNINWWSLQAQQHLLIMFVHDQWNPHKMTRNDFCAILAMNNNLGNCGP